MAMTPTEAAERTKADVLQDVFDLHKATELQDPRTAKAGCQRACCDRRPGRISHSRIWQWSRQHPGVDPFKPGVRP